MKLFEIRKKPELAGRAKLKFSPTETTPSRKGGVITLPSNGEVEMFPIKNGEQFILRIDKNFVRTGDNQNQVYFGGTDENPFLVRMHEQVIVPFINSGEEAFYDSLKPRVIEDLEKVFKVTAKRQGDFFALELPYPWEEVERLSRFFSGEDFSKHNVKNEQVLGTRHTLSGNCGFMRLAGSRSSVLVGEGIMKAPDHKPMVINGPHIIVQADNLWDPPKAD